MTEKITAARISIPPAVTRAIATGGRRVALIPNETKSAFPAAVAPAAMHSGPKVTPIAMKMGRTGFLILAFNPEVSGVFAKYLNDFCSQKLAHRLKSKKALDESLSWSSEGALNPALAQLLSS